MLAPWARARGATGCPPLPSSCAAPPPSPSHTRPHTGHARKHTRAARAHMHTHTHVHSVCPLLVQSTCLEPRRGGMLATFVVMAPIPCAGCTRGHHSSMHAHRATTVLADFQLIDALAGLCVDFCAVLCVLCVISCAILCYAMLCCAMLCCAACRVQTRPLAAAAGPLPRHRRRRWT